MHLLLSVTLSATPRGILALILEIALLLSVLIRRGQDEPLLASPENASRKRFLFAFFPLKESTPILLAGVIVGLCLALLGHTFLGLVFALIAAFLFFDLVAYGARVHAHSGSVAYYWGAVGLSQALLLVFGIVMFLADNGTILGWLVAYALPGALLFPAIILVARRQGWRGQWSEARKPLGDLREAGLRLFPGILAGMLTLRLERFLVPLFFGFGSLGVFVVVAGLMDLLIHPVRLWILSSLSRWSSRSSEIRRTDVVRKLCFLLALSTLPISALSVVAVFVITNFLDATYAGAEGVVLPLAASSLGYVAYLFTRGVLIAQGRYHVARNLEILSLLILSLAYTFVGLNFGLVEFGWTRMAVFWLIAAIGFFLLVRNRR